MGFHPGTDEGGPIDEYYMEAEPIASYLIKNPNTSTQELSKVIDETWIKFFSQESGCAIELATMMINKLKKT